MVPELPIFSDEHPEKRYATLKEFKVPEAWIPKEIPSEISKTAELHLGTPG